MSNIQFFPNHQSIVNNSLIKRKINENNTKSNYDNNGIRLSHENSSKIDLRNYPTSRESKKMEVFSLKQNEIQMGNAFQRAEISKNLLEKRENQKREVFLFKEKLISKAISERKAQINIDENEEKLSLETDIVSIIGYAMKFTKKNNALSAMLSNQIIENIKNYRNKERKSSFNSGLNRSITSLLNSSINQSRLSNNMNDKYSKYDSNRFLNALGIDVSNIKLDNISIDINHAMKEISKWRLVDKEKIRKLIRMRVINEISSIEERRLAKKAKRINEKYKKILKKDNENKQLKEISKENKEKEDGAIKKKEKSIKIVNQSKSNCKSLDYNSETDKNLVKEHNKQELTNNDSLNESKKTIKTIKSINLTNDAFPGSLKNYNNVKVKEESQTEKVYTIYKPIKKKMVMDIYEKVETFSKIAEKNRLVKENATLVRHFGNILKKKTSDKVILKGVEMNKLYFE